MVPLSALVTPVDDRKPEPGTVVLSVSESLGIVPQTKLFKKRIALEDISAYKRVQFGDIAYNPFLLWNGAAGVCFEAAGGCVSPAYQVLRPKHSGTELFLHYLM